MASVPNMRAAPAPASSGNAAPAQSDAGDFVSRLLAMSNVPVVPGAATRPAGDSVPMTAADGTGEPGGDAESDPQPESIAILIPLVQAQGGFTVAVAQPSPATAAATEPGADGPPSAPGEAFARRHDPTAVPQPGEQSIETSAAPAVRPADAPAAPADPAMAATPRPIAPDRAQSSAAKSARPAPLRMETDETALKSTSKEVAPIANPDTKAIEGAPASKPIGQYPATKAEPAHQFRAGPLPLAPARQAIAADTGGADPGAARDSTAPLTQPSPLSPQPGASLGTQTSPEQMPTVRSRPLPHPAPAPDDTRPSVSLAPPTASDPAPGEARASGDSGVSADSAQTDSGDEPRLAAASRAALPIPDSGTARRARASRPTETWDDRQVSRTVPNLDPQTAPSADPAEPALAERPAAPAPGAGANPASAPLQPLPAMARGAEPALPTRAAPAEQAIEQALDLARESEWLDRLAREISAAGRNDGTLRFRLHPQTLGHMRVELSHGDQGTHVRLSVESEAARAILADAQPRLLAEARAQGVRIAETSVQLAASDQQASDQRRQNDMRQAPMIRTAARTESSDAAERQVRSRSDRYA